MGYKEMLMKEAREKQEQDRAKLFNDYLQGKYRHTMIDFDSMQTLSAINKEMMDFNRFPQFNLHHLVELIAELDLAGKLRRLKQPEVIVKEVEVPAPPKKISKADAAQQVGLSGNKHIRTEFDRYSNEHPGKSEAELTQAAAKDLEINRYMNLAVQKIENYAGRNHSATQKGRAHLREFLELNKRRITSIGMAEKFISALNEKIDSMFDSGSIR